MKDKIIGIWLAIVLASGIYLSVFGAGEGASQAWVNMRIAEQETNTQATVDLKLSEIVQQMKATQAANWVLLGNTNDTNRVEKAINNLMISAEPLSAYIFSFSGVSF